MAYADVNADSLVSAIKLCKSNLNAKTTSSMLADAKAIPWDGSGAQENLINSISQINSKTNNLLNVLDSCLSIATMIKEYKNLESDIKKLSLERKNLKARYDSNPTAPTAGYIKSEISNKTRIIESKKSKLDSLGSSLSGAGFPPV